FIAIGLAALIGFLMLQDLHIFGVQVLAVLDGIGTIFLNALKMLVVPLIVAAIMSRLNSIGTGEALCRAGWKMGLYYISTRAISVRSEERRVGKGRRTRVWWG